MFEHKILPNNFFIFYVQSLALNLLISGLKEVFLLESYCVLRACLKFLPIVIY